MDYAQIQTVDWVIGAFIMVQKEVYEKTKGMDEYYFMYAEDLDGNNLICYPVIQGEQINYQNK